MLHTPGQATTNFKMQGIREERPLTGVKVLLVEDELDIADLLVFILKEAGADVTWVCRSSEALQELDQKRPDILISNIKLPDRDGDWLIQAIRQAEAERIEHLPAIAITSYTREVAAQRMLEAGFEEYLPKNFAVNDLIATILRLIQ